jgi:hypothetical protein
MIATEISMTKFVKIFWMGIARLYFCLILYNVTVWLPIHFRDDVWHYYSVESIVFYFPPFFMGLQGLGVRIVPLQVWEVFAAPALVGLTGVFCFFKLNGRFRIFGLYLILLSSFCLMSFIIGLLLGGLPDLYGLRISLLFLVGFLIAVVNLLCFYHLSCDPTELWMTRLAGYFYGFFLPSAIVSFLMAGSPALLVGRSGLIERQNHHLWTLFDKSMSGWNWRFEGWEAIFLPVISIGAIATIIAIIGLPRYRHLTPGVTKRSARVSENPNHPLNF